VVDDDLVAAIRAQGGLHGLRDGLAGLDVTDDSSIFGVVTALTVRLVHCGAGTMLCGRDR
jgi:hypothetical protein